MYVLKSTFDDDVGCIALFDEPLEMTGKRSRKLTQRLDITLVSTPSAKQVAAAAAAVKPSGSGVKLDDIPNGLLLFLFFSYLPFLPHNYLIEYFNSLGTHSSNTAGEGRPGDHHDTASCLVRRQRKSKFYTSTSEQRTKKTEKILKS